MEGHQPSAKGKVGEVTVRPLREADLDAADRVKRLAFGTFLGFPDPLSFVDSTRYVHTRWRADPSSAFAAELAGEVVGSVFVAKDARHLVAAVTKPRPTVGLVFYDLKTCLRMLEREEEAKAEKATKTATRRRTTKKKTEEAESESA